MAVEWVAGSSWNQWPDVHGMGGRMPVESARMERRMQAHPEMMVSRRSIVEHPFGNLKQWLFGNARFLLRQLEGTRAEMALAVNAYNLKRAINVLGARQLMALMG